MSTASKNILILSSNTGGGHRSAAMALQDSLLTASAGRALVHVTQVLEEAHFLTRRLADLYNLILRDNQAMMRYYYRAIEKLRPYESQQIFQLSKKYGVQLIDKLAPNVLVSVHPMTQHFFAYLLKTLRLVDKIPLITVVTDPCAGFWQGWACPEVSQYCVANTEAKAQLIEYGIPEERIKITGMPVHSRFRPLASDLEKMALREELGLDPHRFTVFVNAGYIGGGNVPTLYDHLLDSTRDDVQVVFLAGQNPHLYARARQMAKSSRLPVKVLGYQPDLARLMNASDLMISKLGGLTTFEAMACELPIFADCLTEPMPQEAGTARLLQDSGAGVLMTDPRQIHSELHRLLASPTDYSGMRNAARTLGRPGASDQIAGEILSF